MTKADKKQYIQAAKDLYYPKQVISDIQNAKTESECIRILTTARHQTK